MKNNDFRQYRYKIILGCSVFSFVCAVLSLLFLRDDLSFIGGLAIGTVTLSVNLILLEAAVNLMVRSNRVTTGVGIHVVRILIYGITGILAYRISTLAVIGYGISVIGLPVSSGITFLRKEGADGKL